MLRFELTTQLRRLRSLMALAGLVGVPVAAALPLRSSSGHQNGDQGGLYGASPYSALNHAMAGLAFVGPLLLPIVVALLATAIASADRDWGILRYLYVAPVTRLRLLTAKLAATAVAAALAVLGSLAGGLGAGIAFFGWHPFHVIGAADLSTGVATGRALIVTGYLLLCMLAMATIAFTLGLLLPRGAEALALSIAFVVVASVLNGQGALSAVVVVLPVHYWQNWIGLFDPAGATGLLPGTIDQLATIAVGVAVSWFILWRRDPAA